MASRDKDQADFDLDRFIDLFDEAITSNDPRVVETLRSLMMIVTLTRPEVKNASADKEFGPLRRLREDVFHLNKRIFRIEETIQNLEYHNRAAQKNADYEYMSQYKNLAALFTESTMSPDVASQYAPNMASQIKTAAISKGTK